MLMALPVTNGSQTLSFIPDVTLKEGAVQFQLCAKRKLWTVNECFDFLLLDWAHMQAHGMSPWLWSMATTKMQWRESCMGQDGWKQPQSFISTPQDSFSLPASTNPGEFQPKVKVKLSWQLWDWPSCAFHVNLHKHRNHICISALKR